MRASLDHTWLILLVWICSITTTFAASTSRAWWPIEDEEWIEEYPLSVLDSVGAAHGKYVPVPKATTRELCRRETAAHESDDAAAREARARDDYTAARYVCAESLLRSAVLQRQAVTSGRRELVSSLAQLGELYEPIDFMLAEDFYERALAVGEKASLSDLELVEVLEPLARLRVREGNFVEAAAVEPRGLRALRSSPGATPRNVAQREFALARVYFDRHISDHNEAQIAKSAAARRRSDVSYARASQLLTSVRDLLVEADADETSDFAAMFELDSRLKGIRDPRASRVLRDRAAETRRHLASPEPKRTNAYARMPTLMRGALDAWNTGQRAEALAKLREYGALDEEQIVKLGDDQHAERTYLWMANTARYSRNLLSMARRNLESRELAAIALDEVLRRKGRIVDELAHGVSASRGDPHGIFQRLQRRRSQLAALRVPTDWRAAEAYRGRRAALRREIRALEKQAYADTNAAPRKALSLNDIRAAIPSNAVLIEMFEYHDVDPWNGGAASERLLAFVIHRSGTPIMLDLGDADRIAEMTRAFAARVAHAPAPFDRDERADSELANASQQLHRLLIDPLLPHLRESDEHWIIAPDGALELLPFAALQRPDGRYVIQQRLVTYVNSARELAAIGTPARSPSPPLVLGNPDYGPESDDGRYFGPLVGTQREASLVAKLLGVAPITGTAASEAAVKNASGPLILHLATHGFYNPTPHVDFEQIARAKAPRTAPDDRPAPLLGRRGRSPQSSLMFSGVALAGANSGGHAEEDGILTAYEAAGLDLRGTQLVVITACESALGLTQFTGQVYGFRRAIALSGARSQLTTLWEIDDLATIELIQDFYERVTNGEPRGEALRAAQRALLDNPRTQHPYFWAGFVSIGAWDRLSIPSTYARHH